MYSHSQPLELDFSKLLGFDQLPGVSAGECQSDQKAQLSHAVMQAKVGGKPIIQTVLDSKIGGKLGIKP